MYLFNLVLLNIFLHSPWATTLYTLEYFEAQFAQPLRVHAKDQLTPKEPELLNLYKTPAV